MGKFGDFFTKIGIVGDYDEDEDDLEEFEDEYVEDKPKKSFFAKKEVEEDEEEEKTFAKPKTSKVVPMRSTKGLEVCVIKPTTIDDAREVTDTLLSGKAVVLNFEGVHVEVAQRIIDFTSGSTYSIDGNLQKITNYIFIATPRNIEVSGDLQELLGASANVGATTSNKSTF